MKDIAGKSAFNTGGASGLGFATARVLTARGAGGILADIDADGVAKAADNLRSEGAKALGIRLDVTDEASWAAAGEAAREFGPVPILFSNAEVRGGSGPFEEVARIKGREYADRRLIIFPGGFVQQHVLQGKRAHDDGAVRLPCAIICQVKDGKITRLDEYFDSAHVAEFRKFADA